MVFKPSRLFKNDILKVRCIRKSNNMHKTIIYKETSRPDLFIEATNLFLMTIKDVRPTTTSFLNSLYYKTSGFYLEV